MKRGFEPADLMGESDDDNECGQFKFHNSLNPMKMTTSADIKRTPQQRKADFITVDMLRKGDKLVLLNEKCLKTGQIVTLVNKKTV
eukprot:UN27136